MPSDRSSDPTSASTAAAGDDRRNGFDPTAPLTAWLSAVQQMSSAAVGSVDVLTQLGQAQWRLIREGMALMSELPLTAVEEGTRGLAQLRDALHAVQLQMALVDEQLAALEQVMQPVQEWTRAWRDLTGGGSSA